MLVKGPPGVKSQFTQNTPSHSLNELLLPSPCNHYMYTGIILCMNPANERWRYIVTASLISWVHTQNDIWNVNSLCDIKLIIFEHLSWIDSLSISCKLVLRWMLHDLTDDYRKVSNIRRTLVGDEIVDHSDVVGASPVGAAPTTSSFST